MTQSLINDFIERRKAGEPLSTSLKNAIFQARGAEDDSSDSSDSEDSDDGKPRFKLFKVNMRGLVDDDPV
jgi:hypothetical protein